MRRTYSQKEIYDYLKANPLNVPVHFGTLEDMQGSDYIIVDYLNDVAMLRDNTADYQNRMVINCITKSYEDRKSLVEYIQAKFLTAPTYSKSAETEYYVAQCEIGVFVYA